MLKIPACVSHIIILCAELGEIVTVKCFFYLLQTVCIQTHLYILQLQAVSSRYHLLELHIDKINLIVEIIVYNG